MSGSKRQPPARRRSLMFGPRNRSFARLVVLLLVVVVVAAVVAAGIAATV